MFNEAMHMIKPYKSKFSETVLPEVDNAPQFEEFEADLVQIINRISKWNNTESIMENPRRHYETRKILKNLNEALTIIRREMLH